MQAGIVMRKGERAFTATPYAVNGSPGKPVNASEVRLAFDSDLTPMRVKERMPGRLVKVYRIEGRVRGVWRTLAEESENFLRHRVHRFRETEITALRVMVTATWGDPSARIFEVRVY